MIKPKSRKHEDRIKALEAELAKQKALLSFVMDNEGYEETSPGCWAMPLRSPIMYKKPRKWWQVWR